MDTLENPQGDALKWLLEMEVVSDPNVLNSIILNIYRLSKTINDVQFVTDIKQKKILVYIELSWFGRKFKQKSIFEACQNMLNDALPSYRKRIVFDREILDKAIKLVKGHNL